MFETELFGSGLVICVIHVTIVMSASESVFSDAEDDPVVRVGAGERKRLRSVEDIVKAMEGKRKRVVSPKHSEKVSKEERSEFLNEINQMIETSIRGAVEMLWGKDRWEDVIVRDKDRQDGVPAF